ncbi:V-type H+-transporting ATPase subunit H [Nematocida sp. AWRm77]|nr:V-type H+-transporting ATPase subunit H [Nematocida sp. AWRm77]
MGIGAYLKEMKEETHKEKIRSILLEIGGMCVSMLDDSELVEALLPLSRHGDLLISLKALQILTRVFRHRNTACAEYYEVITECITEHPNTKKTEQILIFLQRLVTLNYQKQKMDLQLFKEDPLREEVVRNKELMSGILSVCCKRECKYQGLLLLWILTFSKKALQQLESSPMFYMLSFVSRSCKEKELRMSLAIIRNYLVYTNRYSYGAFQKIEELLSVASCKGNKEDKEEQEDLSFCRERYLLLIRSISTFEMYLEELKSGHLQPLPYHFSTEFWRNNLDVLSNRRSEIIKSLKRYLKSDDLNNIWIASNDIYRIAKAYPESVSIIRQMNIPQILFEVLSTKSSEDVRFHVMEALSACYTRE